MRVELLLLSLIEKTFQAFLLMVAFIGCQHHDKVEWNILFFPVCLLSFLVVLSYYKML